MALSVKYDPLLARWVILLPTPLQSGEEVYMNLTHTGGWLSGRLFTTDGYLIAINTSSTYGDAKLPSVGMKEQQNVGISVFNIGVEPIAPYPLSGTFTLSVVYYKSNGSNESSSGTFSYNWTSNPAPDPGQAPSTPESIVYDYSSHLNRVINALDQLVIIGSSISSSLSILSTQSIISSEYFKTITDNSTTMTTNSTTLASNTTTIATNSTTLASNTTTIATKQTEMETHQQKVKELAEGPGIHFIGPYEVFGLVSMYRMMIEQARILEPTGTQPTSEQVAQALIEVRRISELIKSSISKDF